MVEQCVLRTQLITPQAVLAERLGRRLQTDGIEAAVTDIAQAAVDAAGSISLRGTGVDQVVAVRMIREHEARRYRILARGSRSDQGVVRAYRGAAERSVGNRHAADRKMRGAQAARRTPVFTHLDRELPEY